MNKQLDPNNQILQQWECVVHDISKTSFGSQMRDLTQPGTPEEFMVLDIDRVSEDQRDRIQVGALFYCSITRSKQRFSKTRMTIRFSDKRWTKEDLRKATAAAKELEGWVRLSKS